MDVAALNNTLSGGKSAATSKNAVDTQDRFLKLLVAQMQNQDPMNPLDNAQVTSQMAQIQTVTGISGLSKTIENLTAQFTQMQALQSVSLVGRDVTVSGNNLVVKEVDGKKIGKGAYDLAGAADKVKLEILSASGTVIDTRELGGQKAGLQHFEWPADKAVGYENMKFRITASRSGKDVAATTYGTDKVVAINTNGAKFQVKLEGLGMVDYSVIKLVD
ncbi:flagellar hook assembly protein FlgD [Roseateles sp. DAIF2]|uniref:flagellar hook assembly protein FlgD n=1 Tax=Roseateles sp. DAIF2 TaxID=2714952 RepID=UPI0018A24A70|nr:flagellar hook capping FlgD N-terminal domain-containing protein [Roseateles sp. DAIF2]QPF73153.1 flagellar hook assembly protein FlgD [Roseateles sp. DAIF2]